MMQKTRMGASSLFLGNIVGIGRRSTTGRNSSNITTSCIFAKSWNRKPSKSACARILPPSARGYSMTANYSPATMMEAAACRSQLAAAKSRNSIFFLSSLRGFSSSLWSLVAVPRPATLPLSLPGGSPWTTTTTMTNAARREITASCSSNSSSIFSWAVWLIKRTYQPSLLKKKRQCGFMKRKQSVGGRRIFKRRRQKGRKRLFGA
mmetsp:Transcript_1546/g.3419  ORF Transcript_1546/g.3419 Transcript_1546/m.3419 type:complete len:206 (-) Transcript_1546:127-744(-)